MKWTIFSLTLTLSLFGFGFNGSNAQSETEERQPKEIISEIRSLLNQTTTELQNKNSSGASELAEIAYLDNYEFIETPLKEQNETLMEETEVMLREELRDLVNNEGAEGDVQMLVEKIKSNLDQAEKLLGNQTEGN
jgi:hypothetical protein